MPGSDEHAIRELSAAYLERYPGEAIEVLETAPVKDIVLFLEKVSLNLASAVIHRLSPQTGSECLLSMAEETRRRVLTAMDPSMAAMLLGRLSDAERQACTAALDDSLRKEIFDLMTYPPDSAGSIMEAKIPTFRPETTAGKAISKLRSLKSKGLQHLFVVDGTMALLGVLPLAELVLAAPNEKLDSLITGPPVRVQAMASREEVVDIISRTGIALLPVVDAENRFIGAIRQAALVKAVQEDAMSDLQAMVGVSRDERALSSPFFAVRKRLPWLNINLLTAFLAAAVVGIFEDTISRFTALAVLLPVVAGQSGNTGAQALAVTMRGLALREIRIRHAYRVLLKEGIAGCLNGIALAVVTGAGVFVWSRSAGLSAVISSAMVISMVLAALAGAMIPILLTAAKQDPAQSASIILTTVTDVVGFLSFLGLATVFAGFL